MIAFPALGDREFKSVINTIAGSMVAKTNGIVARFTKEPAPPPMLFQFEYFRVVLTRSG